MAASYEIAGRTVAMPCVVRDASAGTAMFEVDAAAAQALLPGDRFTVVETSAGRCQLVLAVIDYRDNDLGAYHEVGITFFVRPRDAAGPEGTFITRLPVDQAFTCEAGRTIWGFPKTIEDIAFDYADDHLTATLRMDGQLVLSLTVPRGGRDEMPPLPLTTYSLIDGAPHATAFTQGGAGSQVVVGDAGVTLTLGEHPVAKELAALGLPAAAVMSTWTERMQATFAAPERLG
ncbi:MAG TPA: acetoacetate decarboxylase family protein [Acidimicrobiales bacterium]|nr:acetoacetate decarboxylase family protein [Acidimicrobiales bacterium]